MILSSDISNHFEQISKFKSLFNLTNLKIIVTFKTRVASKKFPEDTMEDKQLIMNVVL